MDGQADVTTACKAGLRRAPSEAPCSRAECGGGMQGEGFCHCRIGATTPCRSTSQHVVPRRPHPPEQAYPEMHEQAVKNEAAMVRLHMPHAELLGHDVEECQVDM